jgi:hypothetical protein
MATSLISTQQQRIPLVTLDLRAGTGLITKEWLNILRSLPGSADGTTDTTALQAALDAALSRIGTLDVLLAALTVRVAALEAAAGTGTGASIVLLQPSPVLQGQQGEQGPKGETGDSAFPRPLTPIPLEWPEELRSQLELSGLY